MELITRFLARPAEIASASVSLMLGELIPQALETTAVADRSSRVRSRPGSLTDSQFRQQESSDRVGPVLVCSGWGLDPNCSPELVVQLSSWITILWCSSGCSRCPFIPGLQLAYEFTSGLKVSLR